jgi:hypothetical protein
MVGLRETACDAALHVAAADGVDPVRHGVTLGRRSDGDADSSTGANPVGAVLTNRAAGAFASAARVTMPAVRLSACGRTRRHFWGGTRGIARHRRLILTASRSRVFRSAPRAAVPSIGGETSGQADSRNRRRVRTE